MSVSKSVLTTFLSWVEHTEAVGFTQQQIDKLADEYLEVQGVTPPKPVKHGVERTLTAPDGAVWAICYCGFLGSRNRVNDHLDACLPTISTYCPPEKDLHLIRGDSIGMGVHERWYCSCGTVYNTRTVAMAHAEFANASF